MVKNSTMGKLRMVKAMTGRAIPRIRFLKVIYVQTFCMPRENYVKEQVPEGVVLASKTSDKVERRQPQEQQPGAIPHLQHVDKDTEVKCNKIKVERTWGHLDKARKAPVGQRWLLAVHFRFEEVAELVPVSANVQRQLKGVCQFTWFLISLAVFLPLNDFIFLVQNRFICNDK